MQIPGYASRGLKWAGATAVAAAAAALLEVIGMRPRDIEAREELIAAHVIAN